MKVQLLKKVSIFFCLLFFISNLFANDSISNIIEEKKLYEEKYWKLLLHFNLDESEIDDPSFFISKNGKYNKKDELYATINKLLNDKSDNNNSTACKYPARTFWLKNKIPQLKNKIFTPKCELIQKKIQNLDVKKVSLIFPSAYINSPASMYGHTFLRFDKNINTPLISNALNYSAQTNETSGTVFAYKGLLGGYKGYFSTMKYYEKITEYNDLEQRDIWEYNLNLNDKEIYRMLLHIFEIENIYSKYYFIDENCSYNLLWLIELARPSLDLVNRFQYVVLPIDTIREIVSQNVVDTINYRESKQQKMQYILEKIEDKSLAKRFISEPNISLNHLSKLQQIYILDLASLYIPYKSYKNQEINEENKKEYLKNQLTLLQKRSALGKTEKYNIKKPISPLETHLSSKVEIFTNSNESLDFGIKLGYHDIYDIETSFVEGAYIDFFHLTLNQTKETTRLKSLKIINMKSYAKRDLLFRPISWGIEFGIENFNDENKIKLKGDVGLTYGDKGYYYFFDLNPSLYYKNAPLWGLGASTGYIHNFKNLKLGTIYSFSEYQDNIETKDFEIFATKSILKNSAIGLKYTYENLEIDNLKDEDDFISLYYFYYF